MAECADVKHYPCPLCGSTVCFKDGDWLGHADDCYVSEYRKRHAWQVEQDDGA